MPDRGAGPTDSAVQALRRQRDLGKLLSMMGLSFLVLLVVGILRPVRSAIALAGLEPGDFYQVYFVSAIVVLVAPLYNRLADRISWQRLIPAVAVFFAASLVVFRLLYQPGVSWFGLVFYGWYDLLVASLITQFFMATQMFYNARDAKRAYPLVIAAGSTGAALGGATSYLLADKIGAENMLPIAAAIIVVFAVGIALVWAREIAETGPARRQKGADLSTGEFKRIFSHPQVRLIAVTVLLTVLVKQFVDYEYNTLIREVFTDVDEIAGFLGLVDALTQWLPILVLLSLRPILRRWGAGLTVIIFPVAVIFATGALALSIWLSAAALAMAVAARTTEKMFRYSAERTGREILYVPIPDDIKLKAKAYIDVGVEKGVGKVLSGLLLAIPALALASLPVANRLIVVAFAGLALAVGLLLVFLRVRRQYVTSLAESFEGRFASLRGTFVSMADTDALELAREALTDGQPFKVAFALDLLKEADHEDVAALAPELHDLLDHENKQIRAGGLAALIRLPSGLDEERVRRSLEDESAQVRLAAVRLLAVGIGRPPHEVIEELLESREPAVRAAALACLATDFGGDEAERIVEPRFEKLLTDDAAKTQEAGWALELARAAALVAHHPQVEDVLRRLLGHPDPEVASAAVLSATRLPQDAMVGEAIAALAAPGTRAAARAGLAERGEPVLGPLITALNDPGSDPWVRRGVASTLGEIPTSATVNALITSYLLRETEQALDDQALVSLHRLRSGNDDLSFPKERILEAVDREVDAAERYRRAAGSVARLDATPAQALLARGLREVRDDRRASVFRWLGLVYPEAGMRRSYLALGGQDDRQRANRRALEWIESTVGHGFGRLRAPVARVGGRGRTGRERPRRRRLGPLSWS